MVQKRLYRSFTERKIGGVAGGLAEYLNTDVTLIRLIWILTLFLGGAGVFVYLIAWIIIPEEPLHRENSTDFSTLSVDNSETSVPPGSSTETPNDGSENQKKFGLVGLLLVGVGGLLLVQTMVPSHFHRFLWPLLLILLGLVIMVPRRK